MIHSTNLHIYNRINRFGEIIDNVPNTLNSDDKNILLEQFSNLNWSGLENYYEQTSRRNLLNLQFVLYKLVKLNCLQDKVVFEKYFLNMNVYLQIQLWNILYDAK